jgi:hypothetical protein
MVAMRKVVLVAAVALLLLVSGCSNSASQGSAPTAEATTRGPAATTPTPTRFDGDLRTLLLSIPPNATKTTSPDSPPDGQFTLEQAAKAYNDPSFGPEQLRRTGYQRGAEVQWVETDGTWVGVILSQLDTVENAALYARGQQNCRRSRYSPSPGSGNSSGRGPQVPCGL